MTEKSTGAALEHALQFLRKLPSGTADNALPIAQAAMALSTLNNPARDDSSAQNLLSRITETAGQHALSVPDKLPAEAQIAIIRDLLHLQFGFRGDRDTYDDLQNCDMCSVIERRLGLPVALCILAQHIGDAMNIDVQGVGMPGHFLVRLNHPDGFVTFDPFDRCRVLDDVAITELLDRVAGQHSGITSLVPATRRDVLIRLQNNRKTRLIRQNRHEEALQVAEAMLILQPEQFTLWYEAALIATEANNYQRAVGYLEHAMMLTEDAGLIANLTTLRQHVKGSLN